MPSILAPDGMHYQFDAKRSQPLKDVDAKSHRFRLRLLTITDMSTLQHSQNWDHCSSANETTSSSTPMSHFFTWITSKIRVQHFQHLKFKMCEDCEDWKFGTAWYGNLSAQIFSVEVPLWRLPGARGDRPTAAGHSGRQTPNSVLSEVLRVWSFVEEKNLMLPKKTCKILIFFQRYKCLLYVSCHIISTRQLMSSSRVRGLEAPTSTSCWAATRPRPFQMCTAGSWYRDTTSHYNPNRLRNLAVQTVGTSQATRQQGTSHRAAQPRRGPARPWTSCSVAALEPWRHISGFRFAMSDNVRIWHFNLFWHQLW